MSETYKLECGKLVVNAELIEEENGTSRAILMAATPQVLESRADLESLIKRFPGGTLAWFFLGRLIPSSTSQLPWQRRYLNCVDISMDLVATRIEVDLSRETFNQHLLPLRVLEG